MENSKLKLLFLACGLLLFLPMLQQISGLVKEKPLSGAITAPLNPTFSGTKWFEGEYQAESENYLNDKFGFRNYFIRLNNQVAYNLYHTAKANGVIIGKENYLYERSYIDAYYGRDFLGKDSINSILSKVKFLQDALKKKNIDLVLVFNPGKVSYDLSHVPDELKGEKGITNYEYYASKAANLQLNVLDLRDYFISNKEKFPHPLFPKCGIHWSTYCEILAKDTLMKYIGGLRKIDVPEVVIDSISTHKGNRNRDADIKDGMNLVLGPDCGTLAYPNYHIISKNKVKVKTLVVADSFFWGIYGNPDVAQLFENTQFWFYYHELYNPKWGVIKYPNEINLKSEIEQQDVIIIMATESTLTRFGWGFIDAAYTLYQSEVPK